MSIVLSVLIKALMAIGMKLLTSETIEELIIFICDKAAKSTKTEVDDELVSIIKKHLEDKKTI